MWKKSVTSRQRNSLRLLWVFDQTKLMHEMLSILKANTMKIPHFNVVDYFLINLTCSLQAKGPNKTMYKTHFEQQKNVGFSNGQEFGRSVSRIAIQFHSISVIRQTVWWLHQIRIPRLIYCVYLYMKWLYWWTWNERRLLNERLFQNEFFSDIENWFGMLLEFLLSKYIRNPHLSYKNNWK